MATKPNPFGKKAAAPFEKSPKDKEFPAKKFGKEGSKREETFDRKQMKPGKGKAC